MGNIHCQYDNVEPNKPTIGCGVSYDDCANLSFSRLIHVFSGRTFWGDPEKRVRPQWLPMDGIEAKEGSGDIFFKPVVPNRIQYVNPVDDPLYSAHKVVYDVLRGKNITTYAPDYPIRLVSCLQQVSTTLPSILQSPSDIATSSSSVTPGTTNQITALPSSTSLTFYWVLVTFLKPTACSAPSFKSSLVRAT